MFTTYEAQPLVTAHLGRIPNTAWSFRVFKPYEAQPLITAHLSRIPDTALIFRGFEMEVVWSEYEDIKKRSKVG